MADPCGYQCRHAPRHAFVKIFVVLWSDGPPDLLCDFDDLGGWKGDREFSALRSCFAILCWRDEAI